MDEATARLHLARMSQWDSDPVLTEDEKALILSSARRADRYGRAPSDPLWEGTYDLNAGASEAWGLKAAKLVNRYDVSVDQQSIKRSQRFKHCQEREAYYRKRVAVSAPVYGPGRIALIGVLP